MSKTFQYDVKQINDNTWRIGEYYSASYLLCGTQRALLIDCGTGVGDLKNVVEQLTPLPYDVVITHAHVDHVGGRGQFETVFVSESDQKYIAEATVPYRKFFVWFNRLLGNRYRGLRFDPVTIEPTVKPLYEGMQFDLGERTVEVLSTPGHTGGSMSFLDHSTRTLFFGDAADKLYLVYFHCATLEESAATLQSLVARDDFDTAWGAHSDTPYTKADLSRFYACANEVLIKQKRNFPLPCIWLHGKKDARLIYLPHRVHNFNQTN